MGLQGPVSRLTPLVVLSPHPSPSSCWLSTRPLAKSWSQERALGRQRPCAAPTPLLRKAAVWVMDDAASRCKGHKSGPRSGLHRKQTGGGAGFLGSQEQSAPYSSSVPAQLLARKVPLVSEDRAAQGMRGIRSDPVVHTLPPGRVRDPGRRLM